MEKNSKLNESSYPALQTATRLQPLSSLHSPPQSQEEPAASELCQDTRSAAESLPDK